jgi:hypothetical protein
MKAQAPAQLQEIGLNPNEFRYSDAKSWRGPCPVCGGSRRFVIFTDNKYPLWFGYCSVCPNEIKVWQRVRKPISPEQLQAARRKQEQAEQERVEYRRRKLAEFSRSELWEELNERMSDAQRDYWNDQGIPYEIQDYLRLGWTKERSYYDDYQNLQTTEAYTIPWFGMNFQLKTMQYRLINPVNVKDKYRFEKGLGGGIHYYMADPSEEIGDKVIICEGAKKAIVTWFWLQDGFNVIAASSNNTIRAALEATKDSGLRYVVLDPGSKRWERLAKESNPKTTHIVSLPYKIDDGYVNGWLNRHDFMRILNTAI